MKWGNIHMKKDDKKTKENIENLGKVIEESKKIPKEVKEKINSKRFENILYAVIILIYLGALNLGMTNIPTENYLMDLKVFAIVLLVGTIILFELAYRKDISDLWLHGVEVMIISIFTMYLIYLYSIFYNTFGNIVFSAFFIYLIYYLVKIFVTKKIIIKRYNKSLVDIGEIVKKK